MFDHVFKDEAIFLAIIDKQISYGYCHAQHCLNFLPLPQGQGLFLPGTNLRSAR